MPAAIRQTITLEGAEEIKKKLLELGAVGEQAFKKLQDAGAFTGVNSGFTQLTNNATQTTQATSNLREALHALRPALDVAGGGLVSMGALAAASRAGIIGLGVAFAAMAALAVAGVAKSSDEAVKFRNRLGDAFGSKGVGDQAFTGLQESAKNLGTNVDNLKTSFLNLKAAAEQGFDPNLRFPPGKGPVQDVDLYLRALESLQNRLRSFGLDNKEAAKASDDFTSALGKQKNLTAEAVQTLQKASPSTANDFARGLGRGFSDANDLIKQLQGGTKVGVDEVIRTLAKIGPESKKAFEEAKPNVITFGDALDNLNTKLQELLFGGGGQTGQQNPITGFIDGLATKLGDAKKALDEFAKSQQEAVKSQEAGLAPEGRVAFDFQPAIDAAKAAVAGLWTALSEGARLVAGDISNALSTAFNAIGTLAETVGTKISEAFKGVIDTLAGVLGKIKEAAAAVGRALSGGGPDNPIGNPAGDPTGFAGGGVIRGRGTGTSDSILAWLSNGEGVLTARALSYYGPGIVAAINSFRMPRFNMGGLVSALAPPGIPRFAGGGLVAAGAGGLHPVTLNLGGGGQISGLFAAPDTLRVLQREAVIDRMRSSRTPSRGSKRG